MIHQEYTFIENRHQTHKYLLPILVFGLLGITSPSEAGVFRSTLSFLGLSNAGVPRASLVFPGRPSTLKGDSEEKSQHSELISALVWDTNEFAEVQIQQQENNPPKLIATLEWTSKDSNLSFLTKTKSGTLDKISKPPKETPIKYQLQVPLEGEVTHVKITAVDPEGEVQEESVEVLYPSYGKTMEQLTEMPSQPSFRITPALGFSFFKVDQTGSIGVTEGGLTALVKADYFLRNLLWKLGASGSVLTLGFGSSRSSVTAHFINLELHATRKTSWLKSPWQFSLSGGAYFTTLIVSMSALGYQNLGGPQIYPSLDYKFANGDQGSLMLKYSPISNGLGFYTLNNHVFDLQVEWRHLLARERELLVGFALTEVYLSTQTPFVSGDVRSLSLTLNAGYHW